MRSKKFWQDAAERALRTALQTLLAAFGVGQVGSAVGVNLLTADWPGALSLAGSAAFLSLAFSVLSSGRGDPESASWLKPEVRR